MCGKKALKWDCPKGNGENLREWGRARSNIQRDAKNGAAVEEWRGSR